MDKGFTLIEMLLVVAIIGFLVAILLPSVGGVGADAKDKAVMADLRQLKSAVEVYFISFGVYPDAAGWGASSNDLIREDGNAGYARLIDQFPIDAYGTVCYGYTKVLGVTRQTYGIWSVKDPGGAPFSAPVVADDAFTKNDAVLYVTNAKTIN